MSDCDLIAEARLFVNSIPEGIGVLRSLDATRLARARTLIGDLADELEAKSAPVGYITGYRNAEGGWSIEFDGAPFATREEARADLVDAVEHCLPGLTCRTLTVYDEEIS